MNPKINKLRREIGKDKAKIVELQAHVKDLEKQVWELENLDIVGMVREQGLNPEQLAQMLQALKNGPPAVNQAAPVPEPAPNNQEETKEDNPIEQY